MLNEVPFYRLDGHNKYYLFKKKGEQRKYKKRGIGEGERCREIIQKQGLKHPQIRSKGKQIERERERERERKRERKKEKRRMRRRERKIKEKVQPAN